MIILYWAIATLFGIAGVLENFEYTPEWLLVELGGLTLVALKIISGKKPFGEYISPAGLCFAAWILYANVFYLVYSYINYNPVGFSFEKSTIDQGFFLSFTSVSFFGLLFELLNVKRIQRVSPLISADYFLRRVQPFPYTVVAIVSMLVIAYYGSMFASGAFAMIGKADRLSLLDATETGKVWLMHYLLTGATIYYLYCFGESKLARLQNKWFVGFVLASFWCCYFVLGNRRGILTVLLATGVVFAWKRHLRLAHLVAGSAVVLVLMGIGIIRQGDIGLDSVIQIIDAIGEFYFPHLTLLQAIKNSDIPHFGGTFISWLPDFIGAKLNGDSYYFLAQQFARNTAPTGTEKFMGYAYMPLTEAFINFGVAGALLAPLAIVGTFWAMEQVFGRRSLPVLTVSAMALDINRGEFGAIAMQYTFFLLSGIFLISAAFISNRMQRKTSFTGED